MENIIDEDLKKIINFDLPWEHLEGKNILITGANGMLPSYIVETMLCLNEKKFGEKLKIFAVIRNLGKANTRFKRYLHRSDLNFIVQDIREPLELEDEIHYLIHAASNASPKYYGVDPVGTLIPNTIGTYNCLEFAKKKEIESFLYFSSGEVYGNVQNPNLPISEDTFGVLDPTTLRSCYAESKRMAETMCIAWFKQYNIPVKIVRPFHTYGPYMQLDDGRVFADLVSNIIYKQDLLIKGDGTAKRTFCYISDATIAFFLVLLKGQSGHSYNVGGNKSCELSVFELANMLKEIFSEKDLNIYIEGSSIQNNYIKSHVSRVIPDITKIRKLGWSPKTSTKEGFERTVRSYYEVK